MNYLLTNTSYKISFLCILFQLKQPRDSKVTDFWVDINIGSQSISTFVNDDSNNDSVSIFFYKTLKKSLLLYYLLKM